MVLEHTCKHGPAEVNALDPFGVDEDTLKQLVLRVNGSSLSHKATIHGDPGDRYDRKFLIFGRDR